jgi:hypothetical protein
VKIRKVLSLVVVLFVSAPMRAGARSLSAEDIAKIKRVHRSRSFQNHSRPTVPETSQLLQGRVLEKWLFAYAQINTPRFMI